jgi:hypothetical protein
MLSFSDYGERKRVKVDESLTASSVIQHKHFTGEGRAGL